LVAYLEFWLRPSNFDCLSRNILRLSNHEVRINRYQKVYVELTLCIKDWCRMKYHKRDICVMSLNINVNRNVTITARLRWRGVNFGFGCKFKIPLHSNPALTVLLYKINVKMVRKKYYPKYEDNINLYLTETFYFFFEIYLVDSHEDFLKFYGRSFWTTLNVS